MMRPSLTMRSVIVVTGRATITPAERPSELQHGDDVTPPLRSAWHDLVEQVDRGEAQRVARRQRSTTMYATARAATTTSSHSRWGSRNGHHCVPGRAVARSSAGASSLAVVEGTTMRSTWALTACTRRRRTCWMIAPSQSLSVRNSITSAPARRRSSRCCSTRAAGVGIAALHRGGHANLTAGAGGRVDERHETDRRNVALAGIVDRDRQQVVAHSQAGQRVGPALAGEVGDHADEAAAG